MPTRCNFHPANEISQFCETCNQPICQDCVRHENHRKISLKEIDAAVSALNAKFGIINNDIRSLEKRVTEGVNSVSKAVEEAGRCAGAVVSEIRQKEVEISKRVAEIWKTNDPVEVRYREIKNLEREQSRYANAQRLVWIQSYYYKDFIAKAIGRLSVVDENQEIVEHNSFMTPKKTFIKSIRPVNAEQAWVLHHQGEEIHLIDFDGRIRDTRKFGEQIEDFCLQKNGEVLFTWMNGSDLMKLTQTNKKISLHSFDRNYKTRGLCLRGEDVMVCLCSLDHRMPNRVAKMSVSENTAKELDFSNKIELFQPGRVSSLPGGNVAVLDWCEIGNGRFMKVMNGKGDLLWTWYGEMKGKTSISPFLPYDVLYCNINDEKRLLVTLDGPKNKVCSLPMDGIEDAKCIYTGDSDSSCNAAISADPEGNIWIGDSKGRVHIMKGIHRSELG